MDDGESPLRNLILDPNKEVVKSLRGKCGERKGDVKRTHNFYNMIWLVIQVTEAQKETNISKALVPDDLVPIMLRQQIGQKGTSYLTKMHLSLSKLKIPLKI